MKAWLAILLLLPSTQALAISGHPCDAAADIVLDCDAAGTADDPFIIQGLTLNGAGDAACPGHLSPALLSICDSPYHILLRDAQLTASSGLALDVARANVAFEGRAEATGIVVLADAALLHVQGELSTTDGERRLTAETDGTGMAVITLQDTTFTAEDLTITAYDAYVIDADQSDITLRDSAFTSYRWGITADHGTLHMDNVTGSNPYAVPASPQTTLGSHFGDELYGTGLVRIAGTDATILNSTLTGGRSMTVLNGASLFAKGNHFMTGGNVLVSRVCDVRMHYNNIGGALANDANCQLDLRLNNRTGDDSLDQGAFRFDNLPVPIQDLPQTTLKQHWSRDGSSLQLSGTTDAETVRIANHVVPGGAWSITIPASDAPSSVTPLACDEICGVPWSHESPGAPFIQPPIAIIQVTDGQLNASLSYSPIDATIIDYRFTYADGREVPGPIAPLSEGRVILTVTDDIGLRSEPTSILLAPTLESRNAPLPFGIALLALLVGRRL